MTEQARTTNGTAPTTSATPMLALGIGAAIDASKPVVETLSTMYGRTLDGVAAHSLHWSTFMNARVQENLNLSKRLSEVKSPLDVHAAFADYWQMVTAHYQSAVTKSVAEVKSETKDVASAVQQSNGFRSH